MNVLRILLHGVPGTAATGFGFFAEKRTLETYSVIVKFVWFTKIQAEGATRQSFKYQWPIEPYATHPPWTCTL